jgi:hypothetical protein
MPEEQPNLLEDLPEEGTASALSPVKQRLLQSALAIEAQDPASLLYQHTVFCQTSLPYRDPGRDRREWERRNGIIQLKVVAGEALNPETGEWVQLGLPFGPKPRLILAYLNREALIHSSPEIDVGNSLTSFAKGLLGCDPNGREIRVLKDQLARLAGAMVRLGVMREGRAYQINTQVVTAFDLWFSKDHRHRILWPSTVRLSLDYFDSLQKHAVPLDERAIAALSQSAMALDLYAWLAQRLHRIEPSRPQFVPWAAVKEQFGWHYSAIRKFRQVFRQTLGEVLGQYRGAQLAMDERGLTLFHSPPPVKGRVAIVRKPRGLMGC